MYNALSTIEIPDISQFGVFAAAGAAASALIAAASGLTLLWRGPLNGWVLPSHAHNLSRICMLPTCFLIVAGFFYTTRETDAIVLWIAGLLVLLAAAFALRYFSVSSLYKYVRPIPVGEGTVKEISVLGAPELTEWAKATIARSGMDVQQCFSGTPGLPYSEDQMWPRAARIKVQSRVSTLYLCMAVLGTGGLTGLAFVTEVRVLKKPASAILNPESLKRATQSE